MKITVAPSSLFKIAEIYGRELAAFEVPDLQRLFENNPDYLMLVYGRPPESTEAQNEFDEFPPEHLSYTKRWFTGLFDQTDKLIGVAIIVEDLSARHVWHISLFLIATSLHGTGVATDIYLAIERWARDSGARWFRLGVVKDNLPGERFWTKQGFHQARSRLVVGANGRKSEILVLIKACDSYPLSDYLALVPRDQSDSLLI